MKRFLSLTGAALLSFSSLAYADSPDEQFVQYYNLIQEADGLVQRGQEQPALERYRQAEEGLKQLKSGNPGWNPTVVQYRLNYVNDRITPLAKKFPNVTAPKPATAEAAAPNPLDGQLSILNQQIIELRTEKGMLELKLKEALSARPAAVDPGELKKAQEQLAGLRKDNDALRVTLAQEQAKGAKLIDPSAVEKTRKELSLALGAKKDAESALGKAERERADLSKANEELSAKLKAAKAEPKTDPKLVAKVKAMEAEQADLEKKLKEATHRAETESAAAKATSEAAQREKKALEARLASMSSSAPASGKLDEVSRQLKLAQDDLKSQQSMVTNLRKENQKLEAVLIDPTAGAATSQLQKDLASVRAERQSLELALAAARKQNSELEAKARVPVPTTSPKVEELERDLKRLQTELKTQQASFEALRRENVKLEALLVDPKSTTTAASTAKSAEMEKQNRELQEQLRAATAASSKSNPKDAAKIKELEQSKDSLEKELKKATKELDDRKSRRELAKIDQMANDLAGLRARLETLEAKKTPYTGEELALFKAPAAGTSTTKATLEGSASQELPSAARALVADAQRAFAARRLEEAEQKYSEVLSMEKNNVFSLANLAAIQIEKNDFKAAEGNLTKALAIAGNDAYSLSLLGIVRFRQNKFDEALDLLGRSAVLDPKNADTQNYLGITLSQKGQRGPAEAALRKAIQLAPGNASAHHNLAVVYATQQPPMIELARWHYQKAISNGHSRNADLEKKFEQK